LDTLNNAKPGAKVFRRWLSVVLRGLHLVTVVTLGAAILGAPLSAHAQSIAVFVSGLAMTAVDFWGNDRLWRERAGHALLLKLALVGWMAVDADVRVPLFWLVLAWSALFAHAPASFRHAAWPARIPPAPL